MAYLRNSGYSTLAGGAASLISGLRQEYSHRFADAQSVARRAQAGADSDVATHLKSSLRSSPTFDAKHVDVALDKGNVVLKGFVQNNRDLLDATQIATKAAGDHKVVNKLTIKQNYPNAP